MLRRASQGHVQKDALVAGRLVVDAVVGHLLSAQRAVVDVPGEDVAQVLVAGADGEQELQKEDRPEAHAGEKRRGHERGALVQQQHLRRVQVEAGGAVGDVHLRGDERDVRWGGPSGEPGITRITHPVVHLVDVPVRQAEVQEAVAPVVVHVHDLEGGGGGARRAESVTVLRGEAEHETVRRTEQRRQHLHRHRLPLGRVAEAAGHGRRPAAVGAIQGVLQARQRRLAA